MIEIKPYKSEYANQVYEIEKRSFSSPWSESIFEKLNNVPCIRFFVAVENDKIVGYCGLNHVVDESQIINIAVCPDNRNRGIGDMLMNKMIDYALKNSIVILMLEVRQSNVSALSLYKKYGFYEVGVRKGYYKDPLEDAVLMNKDLLE